MRIGEVNAHRTRFQPGLNIRIEKMRIKTWDGNPPIVEQQNLYQI